MSGSAGIPSVPVAKGAASAKADGSSSRQDKPLKRLVIHLLLALTALIAFFPILRVFSVALRPGNKLMDRNFTLIPENASLDAFVNVLTDPDSDLTLWLFNSLVVTIGTATIGVIIAATSAYAFSRYKFPGRGIGLTTLLATQLIPAAMLLVPIYILAVQLKLTNSYVGLVIGLSVTAVPFSIWILKGYYDTVPIELEEAARIDGCSQLEAFYRVLLPLSTPALAIVFLFNFLAAWNDYFLARVLISKEALLVWPLGLQRYQAQFTTQWNELAAASIIISIPVVLLFLYSSKWLVSGVTAGGVKG
jgi:arabinogalactan oligomer/maltooligosaccharide transport system permease protein